MKPKITLTNPTDDELNAAFAEKVAGMPTRYDARISASNGAKVICHSEEYGVCSEMPRFTTSADAVLPWLEKERSFNVDRTHLADDGEEYRVSLRSRDAQGMASTFPRAACIALLRANGVEVVP